MLSNNNVFSLRDKTLVETFILSLARLEYLHMAGG